MKQINTREIENFDDDVAAVVETLPVLVPWTAVVDGVPELIWDENDELVLTEVSP